MPKNFDLPSSAAAGHEREREALRPWSEVPHHFVSTESMLKPCLGSVRTQCGRQGRLPLLLTVSQNAATSNHAINRGPNMYNEDLI